MKTILITTDFSENSIAAAHVGMEFANRFNADVILMHVYSLPMPSSQFPIMIDFSMYENIKQNQLENLKKTISIPNIKIKTLASIGLSFYEEVTNYTDKHPVDLIVMGLTGSSRINELFLGSNTMSLLTHSTIPVLAIPKGFAFKHEMKFAFAYDTEEIKNQINMNLLLAIAKHFHSKLSVFHVSTEEHNPQNYENLQVYFPANLFTFETIYNEHTDPGILEYVETRNIDILAVVPKKHKFFDRLFHEGHTKGVAHHVHVPLLTLPE